MNNFENRINEWMDIARQHGAIFDNMVFAQEPWGIKAIAPKPEKPSRIRMPENLLIEREGIELTENDQQVLMQYCENEEARKLLNEILGYIMNAARIHSTREFYEGFSTLPEILKIRLNNMGLTTNLIEDQPLTNTQIKERLLQARVIKHKTKKTVFMPFVDFINHDPSGISYDMQQSAIVIQGNALSNGEIYAIYSNADPFHLLNTYFYPGKSHFAYSVAFTFTLPDGLEVTIGRRFAEFDMTDTGLRLPKIEKDKIVHLSNVWIGSPMTPRKPYWSFEKAWQSLGRDDAFKVWSMICRFNWVKLVEILRLAEEVDSPTGKMVRTALIEQMTIFAETLTEIEQL